MGIISTQTIQIGKSLVKTFGEGQNLKKVVTETLEDGNILTRVFNSENKLLTERLKKNVGNMEEVGDKLVKTTTKVIKDKEGVIKKQVRDRVYDKALVETQLENMQKRNDLMKVVSEQCAAKGQKVTESQLLNNSSIRPILGTDESKYLYNLNNDISSTKPALGQRITTYSESGNIFEKVLRIFRKKSTITYYDGNIRSTRNSSELPRSRFFNRDQRYNQHYNEKGLLLPKPGVYRINDISLGRMSLKNMRRLFQKFYPGERYSEVPSLASLDEPIKGDRITKLEKFL